MSCNIRIPIQQIIDDVAAALSGRYISTDNPFLNEAVLTDTTLRGDVTADTAARNALCGILQTCGVTAEELEWLARPENPGSVPISSIDSGEVVTTWQDLKGLVLGYGFAEHYNTKKAYQNYASMLADKGKLRAGDFVGVLGDTERGLNGTYQYDGVTFIRAPYDPVAYAVDSSNEYTDNKIQLLEEDVSAQGLDTGIIATAKFGGIDRPLYEKLSEFISVIDLAIPVAGDWSPVFQKALDLRVGGWTYLRVPAGTYRLDTSLRVHKKTVILLDPGVVLRHNTPDEMLFLNAPRGDMTYATGYEGDGDIYIRGYGALIDLQGAVGMYRGMMRLGHASNVYFEGFEVTRGHHAHNIEVNSSRNVGFFKVKFTEHLFDSGTGYESIQIDDATAAGMPEFGAPDGTVCESVVIEQCYFKNAETGVGTHSTPTVGNHKNISVKNCTFIGMHNKAIRAQNWDGGEVIGNTISSMVNETANPIVVWGSNALTVKSNNIDATGLTGSSIILDATNSTIYSKNNEVSHNIITNCGNEGITVVKASYNDIHNNFIYNAKVSAIVVNSSAAGTFGNKIHHNTLDGLVVSNPIQVFTGSGLEIYKNTILNNTTAYDINIRSGASATKVWGNKGTANVHINNNGVNTEINGRTNISGVVSVVTGLINLTDSINNYESILVQVGTATAGGLSQSTCVGWAGGIFRVNEDFVTASSDAGKVIMSIPAENQLNVTSTTGSVRSIIGINRK